jgi:hypothetical protein
MEKIGEIKEPPQNLSYTRDRIYLIAAAVFFCSIQFLPKNIFGYNGLLLLLLIIYLLIQEILHKKSGQKFSYGKFLKKISIISLVLLPYIYILTKLTEFVSAIFHDNLIYSTISTILVWIAVTYLMILSFQFIGKHIEP